MSPRVLVQFINKIGYGIITRPDKFCTEYKCIMLLVYKQLKLEFFIPNFSTFIIVSISIVKVKQ